MVAGVTGTNGKTTTAHFIAQAWHRSGGDAGLIGTIGYGPLDALKSSRLTTPDPISLQGMLANCIEQGVEKVAMEVSSHALDQGRCDDVAFDAAVFTNLDTTANCSKGSNKFVEPAISANFERSFPPAAIDNIKWYPPVPAKLEGIEGKILDKVKAAK